MVSTRCTRNQNPRIRRVTILKRQSRLRRDILLIRQNNIRNSVRQINAGIVEEITRTKTSVQPLELSVFIVTRKIILFQFARKGYGIQIDRYTK